jgi:hypothetical protein
LCYRAPAIGRRKEGQHRVAGVAAAFDKSMHTAVKTSIRFSAESRGFRDEAGKHIRHAEKSKILCGFQRMQRCN